MSNAPITLLRADVEPLGETYTGATLQVLPTGELVTIDVEFYRSTKTRVILTYAQAKALKVALDDALGKAAYCILRRQQDEADSKRGVK
jgi:hypothetical protein